MLKLMNLNEEDADLSAISGMINGAMKIPTGVLSSIGGSEMVSEQDM